MLRSKLILDRDFAIGPVDPRLYGGFVEHLGRCIYGGLYEPGHPQADEDGFRTDVLALVRDLNMPVMRWPGGNFVSGYNWRDGVGPREQRPRRLDLAWKSTETNAFGINEFVAWCRKAGSAPMVAVNLGTAGPDEARQLVEYCNHPGGTAISDLRRQHGVCEPHGVKLWCLGNEMDGPWQMGHKTAVEYGRVACEAAKLMKWVDPSIELVACGSSGRSMPTFGTWERQVLELCYDQVDYLSIHTYLGKTGDDTPSFLAMPDGMGEFIEEVTAICDATAATLRKPRRMMLSFDEWNVWYHSHGDRERLGIPDWAEAPPLLEDVYTMEDALVAGGMLIALINHADRVKIACLAQVVNVIGAIMTRTGGPAWRQTIYWPLLHASRWGRGVALRPVVDCPRYDCRERPGAPTLAASAVSDPETGALTVFAVNRSVDQPMDLSGDLRAFAPLRVLEHHVLRHDDLLAANTAEAPDNVVPAVLTGATCDAGRLSAPLPPASWNVLRLGPA